MYGKCCWYIAIDTLSTEGSLFFSIPPYHIVRDSLWEVRRMTFCCVAFGSAVEQLLPPAVGGAEIYFHPSSAFHPCKHTDPLIGLIGPPSSLFFLFHHTFLHWNYYKWSETPPLNLPKWGTVDHSWLICPRPSTPPLIPPIGCTTTCCNLLWAPLTGWLIGHFATIGSWIAPFANTNSPQGCCHHRHWGGHLFPSIRIAWRPPTSSGSVPRITCGRMSAPTNKQRLATAFLTSALLTTARRLLVANVSLTSVPPTNARRLPVVNNFSTRRPLVANALSSNEMPRHKGWQPLKPSSFGFATAASESDLPKTVWQQQHEAALARLH